MNSLCDEYEQARTLAIESGQPGAAVSATTGKARVTGLEHGDKKSGMSEQPAITFTMILTAPEPAPDTLEMDDTPILEHGED